ncbi:phosphotransferase enzyme family protein [Actinopolymorpha pittospori]|uniref:Ser/Thr protein kinase RdoA (MazF antagonist) n=1 Tax=Actinopolymorpha pittospori TaxID=648752 RepID=A0A927ND15_9ACTN|nr:phosphotransferase [Actinopolymorpha pittospori]MBE1612610.1 Ser/Thr protein kinase RdoA (MazF antagonist) [Actinopolymorpha pittospori]
MDEYAALEAWKSVVGAARAEPMNKVHNPIWKVTGEDGREWVLKHLPEWSPGVGPVEEYRVLCYLQAGGLPVAVPIVTDAGLIVHNADNLGTDPSEKRPTGTQAYALIPLLPNDPERHESPELAHTIGDGIGRLDRMLAECPWQVTSFTDDPAPDILGDDYAKLPAELRDLVDPLRAQLWAALTDLPTQLTHGDCNAGNVLVHNGQVTGYIDLDHLPYGPRVRDLSYYLASRLLDHIIDGDAHAMAAVLRHYVAGYHSIHPLTERELAAVVPLLLTASVGSAGWCLHGWVPNPTGYQGNLRTVEWVVQRYDALVSAAAL